MVTVPILCLKPVNAIYTESPRYLEDDIKPKRQVAETLSPKAFDKDAKVV